MWKVITILVVVSSVFSSRLSTYADAAERYLPPKAERSYSNSCGCCGCLGVSYDYHRELRSTYGSHFDPRNYDQTEPHYNFGKMRAYPQYWTYEGGYEPHY
jgi:hypothetical protein